MALRVGTAIAGAVLLALAPAAAFAQDTTVEDVQVTNDMTDGDQESGDKGLWGLLGLLGLLAPLLNRNKEDVHVNRTTTTTTGTTGRNDGNPLT